MKCCLPARAIKARNAIGIAVGAIALASLSGCHQGAPTPIGSAPATESTTEIAHKVAQVEIDIARISNVREDGAGGGNHPEFQIIEDMENPNSDQIKWDSLSAMETATLHNVMIRIAAAQSGYDASFQAANLGYNQWNMADIIKAAQDSASGPYHGDPAAALALQELHDSQVISGK